MLMEAYIRIITGDGPAYQDQLQQWIRFLEYGDDMAVGPLHTHRHNQNGMGRGDQYRTPPPQGGPSLLSLLTEDVGSSLIPD